MVTRKTTLLALCCALATTLFSQSFDSGFQPFITRPGDVECLSVLPDGRFLAAGSFSFANREQRANIARFLADGSLDGSFRPAVNFAITAMAVQPDGKVLVGGSHLDESAPEGITVLRLHTDGSLDNSFQAGFAPDGSFADIAVENNGAILVGGSFNSFDGQAAQGVVRLSSNGSLQNIIPLNANGVVFVSSLLAQANGRFAVGGVYNEEAYLSYHEYSGAPVAGFNFSITLPGTANILVSIRSLDQDNLGRIVFSAGTFLIRYAVGIISPNGNYAAWNYVYGIPRAVAVDGNNNIRVAGDFEGVSALHAFNPATGLTAYAGGAGADGLIRCAAAHPAGGFLIAGPFSAFNGQRCLGLARLSSTGAPMAGFGAALESAGVVRSMVRSGDDKLYISGQFAMAGDTYSPNIARLLLETGQADPGFTNPGISYENEIRQITLDAQGRVLAAGVNSNNAEHPNEAPVMRLLPNGAFDPAFQIPPALYPLGGITKVQPLPNGQLLVIGSFTVFDQGVIASKAALYNADGSLAPGFSSRIQAADVTDVLLQADGKILLGGRDIRYDGAAPQPIIRLDAALNRDPSFLAPSNIICTSGCRFKFTELEDHRLLVGGAFRTDPGQATAFRMIRLLANGALDDSFQLAGAFDNHEPYVDGGPRRMLSMPDGKILAVGLFDSLGMLPAPSMILLEADGSVADNLPGLSFGRQFLFDAFLLDDGSFLVGGILSDPSRPAQSGLARVIPAALTTASISGQVYTFNGVPVEGVEIGIVGQPSGNLLTDNGGRFTFSDPDIGGHYQVMPMLNIGHTNGVSTLDLLLISQHILGNDRLDSPYQIIAGDANNSQSLTTLDLISIQKLILGRITVFPNNFSWRFVDAAYIFPNPANPWQEPFPEMVEISSLPAGGFQHADFIAVKVGDVDGSAIPALAGASAGRPFRLTAGRREMAAGEVVQAPVFMEQADGVRAFQFTLRFDPSALSLEGVAYGLVKEEDLGWDFLDKGWITASCYQMPERIEAGTPLFTLNFRARRPGKLEQWLSLGSDFTPAEAYGADGEAYRPELVFLPGSPAPPRLLQNTPNPFSEEAAIGFELETAGAATLLIHSPEGRLLRKFSGWYEAGYREITLNAEGLPEGVLFYTLQAEGGAATGKMVVRR